ncbi:MAG: carboxylate--amine ligase [Cyclobacteriaceae bacterium]|nr:carboxylate--amine ligase [Cyclobacteriaceae bacterium]MCH8516355.1 carboxylate--amine ligase [Cyclobacteriaceae bacterium]
MSNCIALLGWSLPAIESIEKLNKPFVVVSFPAFESYAKENNIPFVGWDFNEWNETSNALALKEKLDAHGVHVAVALFEETVEWAGALNSLYRNDDRVLNRAMLCRNKAMMKRKALIGGLRVGMFEEVDNKESVVKFMNRLNEANLQLEGEDDSWVHLKPLSAMGTVGHKLLRSKADIDAKVIEKDFPCLVESHLPGQEFSCEVFVHGGKIQYLNITEYVKLGFSNFIPCSDRLESKRDLIWEANQKLVNTFGIEYGMLHPEWFLTEDGTISFGETAMRVPGGHIFELIEMSSGFNAFQALVLCSDPKTTQEELDELFAPAKNMKEKVFAGSLMVYPKPGHITKLNVPSELTEDSYFVEHTLHPPFQDTKVPEEREGFGNHYGTIFFKGEDSERMRDLLMHYEDVAFYV